jgi:hypothetical protein
MPKPKKPKTYDIVDLIFELRTRYPHVELICYKVEKPIGRDYYTFFKFTLKKLFNITFEPEVKTSLSFLQNDEITESEFLYVIEKMEEGFSLKNLL